MMENNRKLIVYIAASIDGFIAKPNDDLSFLSTVEKVGEDYGYADFIATIDTVIVGRKTYDWVLQHAAFPHADKQTFVITHTPRPAEGNIQFYNGDIVALIQQLKSSPGKHIFCDGGAAIVNLLLQYDLIDELIISVIPILLGNGTRLFATNRPEQLYSLISSQSFDTGLVQLKYERKRQNG
jgi:dihydrofolate reductase